MRYELTAAARVLHAYVLLVLAGVLMELALVAVVLAVAAAHRLLGFALAAQGAHAFSRQAVRRLDARAAVAAGHLGAGVLQGCGGGRRGTNKVGLLGEQIGFSVVVVHLSTSSTPGLLLYSGEPRR